MVSESDTGEVRKLECEQATICLPAELIQKIRREAETSSTKAQHHCNDFFIFPDDANKRLIIAPTRENSVIDIEIEKARELAQIILYQIQEWSK